MDIYVCSCADHLTRERGMDRRSFIKTAVAAGLTAVGVAVLNGILAL